MRTNALTKLKIKNSKIMVFKYKKDRISEIIGLESHPVGKVIEKMRLCLEKNFYNNLKKVGDGIIVKSRKELVL